MCFFACACLLGGLLTGTPTLAIITGSASRSGSPAHQQLALPVDLTASVRVVAAARRAPDPVYVTQPLTAEMVALQQAASYLHDHPVHRSVVVRASRSAAPGQGRFVWPHKGIITGPFGEPRANGPHPGIDINGHIGDPVGAGAAGTVSAVGVVKGFEGYGMMVLLDHGNGLLSIYAHLSQTNVGVGQVVQPGDLIGAVGCTGMCTGPHLHFEVRVNNTPVDPVPLLPPQ